jgi:hypothetical protein
VTCFRDYEGEQFSIELSDQRRLIQYSAIYDTCDYDLEVESIFNCKGGNSICWDIGACSIQTVDQRIVQNLTIPHGYGCGTDVIGCETYCHHRVACVSYRWEVTPYYDKCGQVYEIETETWEIVVKVSYKGIVKSVTMGLNMPYTNLNDIMNNIVKSIPMYVINYDFPKDNKRGYILEFEGSYYDIEASPLDMPIKDKVRSTNIGPSESGVLRRLS